MASIKRRDTRLTPFDPFPFVMLATIASVEAIFLSTFVLISQYRMARLADLHLRVNLLAEHEITRLLEPSQGRREARRAEAQETEIAAMKQEVGPKQVLEHVERAEPRKAR